jgi:hypothetical protein
VENEAFDHLVGGVEEVHSDFGHEGADTALQEVEAHTGQKQEGVGERHAAVDVGELDQRKSAASKQEDDGEGSVEDGVPSEHCAAARFSDDGGLGAVRPGSVGPLEGARVAEIAAVGRARVVLRAMQDLDISAREFVGQDFNTGSSEVVTLVRSGRRSAVVRIHTSTSDVGVSESATNDEHDVADSTDNDGDDTVDVFAVTRRLSLLGEEFGSNDAGEEHDDDNLDDGDGEDDGESASDQRHERVSELRSETSHELGGERTRGCDSLRARFTSGVGLNLLAAAKERAVEVSEVQIRSREGEVDIREGNGSDVDVTRVGGGELSELIISNVDLLGDILSDGDDGGVAIHAESDVEGNEGEHGLRSEGVVAIRSCDVTGDDNVEEGPLISEVASNLEVDGFVGGAHLSVCPDLTVFGGGELSSWRRNSVGISEKISRARKTVLFHVLSKSRSGSLRKGNFRSGLSIVGKLRKSRDFTHAEVVDGVSPLVEFPRTESLAEDGDGLDDELEVETS